MQNKNWYDYPVNMHSANDTTYQSLLTKNLPYAIEKTKPELIIYNAGSDIYEKDPLGHMNVTKQGIITRDVYVFGLAKQNKIPIVMTLSGGYTSESAEIIGESIENIIKKMAEPNNEPPKSLFASFYNIFFNRKTSE